MPSLRLPKRVSTTSSLRDTVCHRKPSLGLDHCLSSGSLSSHFAQPSLGLGKYLSRGAVSLTLPLLALPTLPTLGEHRHWDESG
eukprot:11004369-Heterocapsa_arctica.AAC.1